MVDYEVLRDCFECCRPLERKINGLEQYLQEMRSRVEVKRSQISKTGTIRSNKQKDKLADLVALQDEIAEKIELYNACRFRLMGIIFRLEDPFDSEILLQRYYYGKTLTDTAVALDYSNKTIQRRSRSAIRELTQKVNESEINQMLKWLDTLSGEAV